MILVVSFKINSSQNILYLTRTYTKFTQLTGQIGGIIQVWVVFCFFVADYFSKYKINEIVMNQLFKFTIDFKEEEEFIKKGSSYKNYILEKENVRRKSKFHMASMLRAVNREK